MGAEFVALAVAHLDNPVIALATEARSGIEGVRNPITGIAACCAFQ
jgi:hypothetical protein